MPRVWCWAPLCVIGAIGCGQPAAPVESLEGPAIVLRPSSVGLDAIGDRAQVVATVVDDSGKAVPDAPISWQSGDPTVATVTGGLVIAVRNGTTFVRARSDTLEAALRVEVRQVGSVLFKVSGDVQDGVVGEPLTGALVARVDDKFGHPVGDVTVYFRVVSGGGTLSLESPKTGATGRASTRWTLGPVEGSQFVAASLTPGAVTPALYNAFARVR
ncbi:MAG TPA: hypothetical protein VGA37_02715 [Gemmatimonadales bacterium]